MGHICIDHSIYCTRDSNVATIVPADVPARYCAKPPADTMQPTKLDIFSSPANHESWLTFRSPHDLK